MADSDILDRAVIEAVQAQITGTISYIDLKSDGKLRPTLSEDATNRLLYARAFLTQVVKDLAHPLGSETPSDPPEHPSHDKEINSLAERYGGYWQGEHPGFPVADWRHEINDNDTRQGYWAWVRCKIEAS